MRLVTFYFGKLNIISASKTSKEFIMRGLTQDIIVKSYGYNWGFWEIAELETEIGTIIHGYLIKYHDETEETADEKSRTVVYVDIANKIISKARFFLNLNSNIIAYHPTSKISRNQFTVNFKKIFEKAHDNMMLDVVIDTVNQPLVFLEALRQFKRIDKIGFNLHPANPNLNDRWKHIRERLNSLNAGDYEEEIIAKEEGAGLANVEEDEDINNKIAMSEDGYGITKVTGVLDNKKQTITTKDNPVNTIAPSDTEDSNSVFSQLLPTFKKIFERFTK